MHWLASKSKTRPLARTPVSMFSVRLGLLCGSTRKFSNGRKVQSFFGSGRRGGPGVPLTRSGCLLSREGRTLSDRASVARMALPHSRFPSE